MSIYSKKISSRLTAAITLSALLSSPFTAIAQTNWAVTSDSVTNSSLNQVDTGAYPQGSAPLITETNLPAPSTDVSNLATDFQNSLGDTGSSYPGPTQPSSDGVSNLASDFQNSLQGRTQKDQQSDQGDSQYLQEQQQKDLQECIKQNGLNSGFGAFSNAGSIVQQGMNNIFNGMSNKIKDSIKQKLTSVLKDQLKQQLTTTVKNSLKQQLMAMIKQQLPQILQQQIQARLAAGQTVDSNYLNQILPDEINSLISTNLPTMLPQILSGSLPQAIGTILQNNLPGIISSSVQQVVPQTFSQMPQLMQANMGDGLDSLLRGTIQQAATTSTSTVTESAIQGADQTIMNQLTSSMTSQLNGSMSTIEQQIIQQITSSIQIDPSTISNTANSIPSQIGNQFNGLADQISNNINSHLDASINQVTGQLDSSMNQIMDPITNSLDQMTGQILDPITHSLDNLVNQTVESLTGSFNSVLNGITTSITNQIQGITDSIVQSVTQPITDAIQNVTQSVVQSVTQPITDAISNVTNQLTSGLTSSITSLIPGVSTITGLISLRVPANTWEQAGSYLSNRTDQIKTLNDDMKKNLIQICLHDKAINRIQAAFEKKTFVEDPKTRRDARTADEQYRQQLNQLEKQGYNVMDNGTPATEPLVPKSIQSHVDEAIQEATKVYLDNLSGTGNLYENQVKQILNNELANGYTNNYQSSLTASDVQALQNNDAQAGWNAWLKLADPRNTYYGSTLLAEAGLGGAQGQAAQNARDELNQGQGVLPIRKCTKTTASGNCAEWETQTPGSIAKDALSQSMQYRMNQYMQARETGDTAPGNEPSSQELRTFTPSTQGGGGGRSSLASFGLNAIFGLASNLLGGLTSGLSGTADNTNQSNQSNQNTITVAPLVTFNFNTPSYSAVLLNQQSNSATLNWTTVNADTCVATNNWWGKQDESSNKNIESASGTLPANGSQVVDLPLNTPITLTRTRGGATVTLIPSRQLDSSLAVNQDIFDISTSTLQANDILNIKSGDQTLNITLANSNTALNINQIKDKINALDIGSDLYKEFSQYNFTYNLINGTLTIGLKPEYNIRCYNSSLSTDKSITITR